MIPRRSSIGDIIMIFSKARALLLVTASVLFAPSAFASLIVHTMDSGTPSGYTAITPPGNTPLSSYSIGDGTVNFIDGAGDPLDPTDGDGWWAFSDDMPIFTTGLPSNSSRIEITFDNLDVYGFAFNIGANYNSWAWFKVIYETANGDDYLLKKGIGVGPNNSPGFNIANMSGGSCHKIKKVIVDPDFTWGVGNMSVDTGSASGCSVQVPEPGTLPLLLIGALGLVAVRKFRPVSE